MHARKGRFLRICDIDGRWSMDGSCGGNGSHYINHCCEPKAYVKTLYGHVLFFALRDIQPGEEIKIDSLETLLPDSKTLPLRRKEPSRNNQQREARELRHRGWKRRV